MSAPARPLGAGAHAFPPEETRGVYRAIYARRDVRAQFTPEPLPDEVLARLLAAAHRAPSVGFMQPWNFVVIRDAAIRREIKRLFEAERERSAALAEAPRRARYLALKLEGILESAVNLCVTCDRTRAGPFVIGRSSMPDADLFSVCCAVQNLWLAARAEGVGVGWVSIVSPEGLRRVLGIPPHVVPVAYLCLGYVTHFEDAPDLERAGWRPRLPLTGLVFSERWGRQEGAAWQALARHLEAHARRDAPEGPEAPQRLDAPAPPVEPERGGAP